MVHSGGVLAHQPTVVPETPVHKGHSLPRKQEAGALGHTALFPGGHGLAQAEGRLQHREENHYPPTKFSRLSRASSPSFAGAIAVHVASLLAGLAS